MFELTAYFIVKFKWHFISLKCLDQEHERREQTTHPVNENVYITSLLLWRTFLVHTEAKALTKFLKKLQVHKNVISYNISALKQFILFKFFGKTKYLWYFHTATNQKPKNSTRIISSCIKRVGRANLHFNTHKAQ